jgi:hypothetical protein
LQIANCKLQIEENRISPRKTKKQRKGFFLQFAICNLQFAICNSLFALSHQAQSR